MAAPRLGLSNPRYRAVVALAIAVFAIPLLSMACYSQTPPVQREFFHALVATTDGKVEADCANATIQIHPDGSVTYNSKARDTHGAQDANNHLTLCLRDDEHLRWPSGLELRAFDGTGCIPVDGEGCETGPSDGVCEPRHATLPNQVYRIPDASDGVVRVDIVTEGSHLEKEGVASGLRVKASESRYAAIRAISADSTLVSNVGIEANCGNEAQLKRIIASYAASELASNHCYKLLLASLIVPTLPKTDQTVTVDGRSGNKATNLEVRDGSTVNAWAYNVRADGSQQLSIVQGGKIVQSTPVGPFLLAGLSALGSPLSVTATSLPSQGGGPPAGNTNTTSLAPNSQAGAAQGGGAQPPATTSTPNSENCACKTGQEIECGGLPTRELIARALAKQLATQNSLADFTAIVSFFRVSGGYNYTAAVLDSTLTSVPHSANSPVTAPTDTTVAPISPVVGASSFKTYNAHRIASALIEEAYNTAGHYAPSGYGYVPVSQTGGDQLYQLRGLDHAGDRLTLSVLAVGYPMSLVHEHWARYLSGALGIAFGPTLMRGSTAELIKQWNLRLVWEIDPLDVPYLALSFGPSWRTYDVINSSFAEVGSVVSVPKPTSTPSFPTESKTDWVWSFGLAVDLAALTDAVAAVTNAASSGAGGKAAK